MQMAGKVGDRGQRATDELIASGAAERLIATLSGTISHVSMVTRAGPYRCPRAMRLARLAWSHRPW